MKLNAAHTDLCLKKKTELMLWQGTALAEVLFAHSDKRLQALQVNHIRKKPNFVNQKFWLLPEQTHPCILIPKAMGTPFLLWLTWTKVKQDQNWCERGWPTFDTNKDGLCGVGVSPHRMTCQTLVLASVIKVYRSNLQLTVVYGGTIIGVSTF